MKANEVINRLNETACYIEQIVGEENICEHHKQMFMAIQKAIELITKNK